MRQLDRFVEGLSVAALTVMVVAAFLGVVSRYVLHDPLSWSEELARYMLIGITFLGTYLGFRRGTQIRMQVAFQRFPVSWQRWCRLMGNVVMALFFLFMAWYRSQYTRFFLAERGESIAVPRGVVYVVLPFTALLYLVHVLHDVRNWQPPRGGTSK